MTELLLNPLARSAVADGLLHWTPRTDLGRSLVRARRFLPDELFGELVERLQRTVVFESQLSLVVFRNGRLREDLGVVSRKVVTTAGVNYLAGAFDVTNTSSVFHFHAFGTGTTAEAITDTALVTELTTQYAVANTRPTGSQAHSTNTYTTVATLSPSSTVTIGEQGVMSLAAAPGGTLWDRSLTGTVALTGGVDSLQATYVLTLTAGG